jgi:hypothetical protein
MKKAKTDELRPIYERKDLGKGTRGKYYDSFKGGTNLVLLDADVAKFFKSDDSVNAALRALMDIAQKCEDEVNQQSKRRTGSFVVRDK